MYEINIAANLCVRAMTCDVNAIEKNLAVRIHSNSAKCISCARPEHTASHFDRQSLERARTGRLMQTDQSKPTLSRQLSLYDRRQ